MNVTEVQWTKGKALGEGVSEAGGAWLHKAFYRMTLDIILWALEWFVDLMEGEKQKDLPFNKLPKLQLFA